MKKFVALYLRVDMCYIIAGISTIVINAVMCMPTDTVVEGFPCLVCVYAAYRTCVELYRSISGIGAAYAISAAQFLYTDFTSQCIAAFF